jgi:MipA family protein
MRFISISCALAAGLTGFIPSASLAADTGLQLQAGGLVAVAPKYEGSQDYRVVGVPIVAPAGGSMDNGMVQFRGIDDLRLRLINFNGFEAGPLGGWRFTRDQTDSDRLRGLGDVDGGLVLGGYAAYHIGAFTPFVSYHADITSDNDTGGVLRFGSEAKTSFGPGWTVTARAGASYADDDYMDAYFSVSPLQSANSAAGLPAYDASSGIKDVFFGLSGDVPIAQNWSLKWAGTYTRLVGDAADSPVIETENQFTGGLGLTYTFNSGF